MIVRRAAHAIVAAGLLFLLQLPALSPGALAQEALWKIDDPAGDQSVVSGAPALAPNPATNHADLRSVTIDSEDELSIQFTFGVESMKVSPRPEPGYGFSTSCRNSGGFSGGGASATASSAQFQLQFELADSRFKFLVGARVLGEVPNPSANGVFVAHSALAWLCLYTDSTLLYQSVPASLEDGKLHVMVPKAALLGQLTPMRFPPSSPEPERPGSLRLGDRLAKFVATSEISTTDSALCCLRLIPIRDSAPNSGTGPEYALRARTANGVVRLGPTGGGSSVPLAPGNQSASFLLTNDADGKRLVRMEYGVEGADASRIKIGGPAAIAIQPRETKNFSVAVDVTGSAALEAPLKLRVRGESTGHPDELALALVDIGFGLVLTPELNLLFLHGGRELEGLIQSPDGSEATCSVSLFGGCRRPFLSSQESDAGAAAPNEFGVRFFPSPNGEPLRGAVSQISALVESAIPFALAKDQPILLELKLASALPIESTIRAALGFTDTNERFGQVVILGEGTATGTSSSSGTVVRINIAVPATETTVVPSGQYLRLQLAFAVPAGTGAAVAATSGLKVLGKESRLILPLVPVPDSALGPALQGTFQLSAVEGAEEFVNPGETRLLNVTLLNQAPDNRTAKLALASNDDAWTAELLPGDTFHLQPGDSIRVGVRIHAPIGAREGEQAVFWLNASDERGSPSSLRLALIATTGVDLQNDAGPYEADDETASRLQAVQPKGSPGLAAITSIFGLLAACAVASARRDRRID